MDRSPRRNWPVIALIVALMLIVVIAWVFSAAAQPAAPADVQAAAPATITLEPTPTRFVPSAPTTKPRVAPTATTQPVIQATTAPATPTPVPQPRVGIQVGHWRSNELPEELARLRQNTGANAAGVTETEVNLAIAERVARLLEAQGVLVDLLPATIPPRYRADAFVAIHADGSTSAATRGFKIATPWRTSPASQHLKDALIAEYAAATDLPQDGGITFNMRGYYAFGWRRFEHAIDRLTPATIVEMGFLSNAGDRALMLNQPDTIAAGIADGVLRYLRERDVTDTAALEPPNIAIQRPIAPTGATIHAAPQPDSRVLFTATPDQQLIPFELRDGWYQVVVRGEWRTVGWVRVAEVQPTNEQLPGGQGDSHN